MLSPHQATALTKESHKEAACPTLFLIMINDFPNLSTYTSQALFADDANIWRSGTNLRQITFHIQEDITKIEKWSLNWGFSINSDKSTAVLFTNKRTELPINITINNQKVKIEEKLKFLGIYFDKKLTWKPQIDEMINKANRLST